MKKIILSLLLLLMLVNSSIAASDFPDLNINEGDEFDFVYELMAYYEINGETHIDEQDKSVVNIFVEDINTTDSFYGETITVNVIETYDDVEHEAYSNVDEWEWLLFAIFIPALLLGSQETRDFEAPDSDTIFTNDSEVEEPYSTMAIFASSDEKIYEDLVTEFEDEQKNDDGETDPDVEVISEKDKSKVEFDGKTFTYVIDIEAETEGTHENGEKYNSKIKLLYEVEIDLERSLVVKNSIYYEDIYELGSEKSEFKMLFSANEASIIDKLPVNPAVFFFSFIFIAVIYRKKLN